MQDNAKRRLLKQDNVRETTNANKAKWRLQGLFKIVEVFDSVS